MPYIDRDKIDFRLPCYFEESGDDALVSIRAVRNALNRIPVEKVAPVEEIVNKLRAKIREATFNPNNKFDFIYDEIYKALDEAKKEYLNEENT